MTFSGTQLTAVDAPLLGVNIDHVATLRNARGGCFPDPVAAAQMAVAAGADIITFHLREDRRHIHDDDVQRLKAHMAVPLNFEAAVTDEMLDIIERIFELGRRQRSPAPIGASFTTLGRSPENSLHERFVAQRKTT